MPQKAKESTLLRQWELLRMLRVSRESASDIGRWDRASELKAKLDALGYGVSLRTVQRDLLTLSSIFALEVNDKNPRDYGWRWKRGARLDITGLGLSESLVLTMAELYLVNALPAATLNTLAPLFEAAKNRINQDTNASGNRLKNWLDKVRIVQPSQPFVPPELDKDIEEIIHQSLLYGKKIQVSYKAGGKDSPKTYTLNPLGLLLRGSVFYLAASAKNYPDAWLYALHRFQSAELLAEPVVIPEGFDLDVLIEAGLGEFGMRDEKIPLKLLCSKSTACYLLETPLAEDQQVVEKGGKYCVTATVNHSWQLRLWIKSQGSGVVVCEPEDLRESIKNDLTAALANYQVPLE